eukprot:761892-Hanusia_phi.AAC.2
MGIHSAPARRALLPSCPVLALSLLLSLLLPDACFSLPSAAHDPRYIIRKLQHSTSDPLAERDIPSRAGLGLLKRVDRSSYDVARIRGGEGIAASASFLASNPEMAKTLIGEKFMTKTRIYGDVLELLA